VKKSSGKNVGGRKIREMLYHAPGATSVLTGFETEDLGIVMRIKG